MSLWIIIIIIISIQPLG